MREMGVYVCMDVGRWVKAPDELMNLQSIGRGGEGHAVPGESSWHYEIFCGEMLVSGNAADKAQSKLLSLHWVLMFWLLGHCWEGSLGRQGKTEYVVLFVVCSSVWGWYRNASVFQISIVLGASLLCRTNHTLWTLDCDFLKKTCTTSNWPWTQTFNNTYFNFSL